MIQLFPLAILIAVKMTPIVAVLFPLLIICLVPIRKQLYRIFTAKELEEVSVVEICGEVSPLSGFVHVFT